MKNVLKMLLVFILTGSIAMSFFQMVYAEEKTGEDVKVLVDGKALSTKGIILNERTMLPVRDLAEALNAVVSWDENTEKVTLTKLLYKVDRTTGIESIEKRDVYLWINRQEASVSGEMVALDVAPQIINDKTMLPARAVCQWLEATVSWDEATKTASVTRGPYESFSEARIHNAQIELVEKNAIDSIIEQSQALIDTSLAEMDNWVSESKLEDKGATFLYGFTAGALKRQVGFYKYGSLSGTMGTLLYEVSDFDETFIEETSVKAKQFSQITMKVEKGNLFFYIPDLKKVGVLQ